MMILMEEVAIVTFSIQCYCCGVTLREGSRLCNPRTLMCHLSVLFRWLRFIWYPHCTGFIQINLSDFNVFVSKFFDYYMKLRYDFHQAWTFSSCKFQYVEGNTLSNNSPSVFTQSHKSAPRVDWISFERPYWPL